MFDEVAIRLQRAKDNYCHALQHIDGLLKGLVANDAAALEDAKALQANYTDIGHTPLELSAAEQPD